MSFAQPLGNTTVLAKGAGVSRAPRVVRQATRPQRDSVAEKAFGAFVGGVVGVTLGMSAMTYAPPAEAGVVLVEQEKKRVFNSPSEPKEVKEAKKAEKKTEKKAEAKKESEFELPSLGLVALPLSVVGIAGAGFAAKTLDDGFMKFMDGALIRDCNNYVGYEVELKSDTPKAGKGTRRVKKVA